jgi:alpha-glucosidase
MTIAMARPAKSSSASADRDWWRGAVIYQIYPRSFADSNSDGIGDLRGVTARLGHVASLGVDAIWLSPFFQSPMDDFGYDVSDYCAIDPMFGTMADFDEMVAEAHRLGLKVMIDQVISHSSDRHPWFRESRSSRDNPKADWYVWADPNPDGTPPNNWLSIFGGSAWEWDGGRKQYYLHNFLASQPDLNFHNPDVQDALLDTVRFWLDRGVDGFRLDTINFYFHSRGLESNPALPANERNASIAPEVNPYNWQDHLYDKSQPENLEFLRRFRALLDEYPAAAAVGEVGDAQRGLEIVAQYTSGGDKVQMCYSFDFLSGDPLTPARVREVVGAVEHAAPDGWSCWAFSNHDVVRHATRWSLEEADPLAFLKMTAMIILSLRGSVCLYQGEELGLTEAELQFADLRDPYGIRFWPQFKGRDGCRTPMVWSHNEPNGGFSAARPWLPVPAEHLRHATALQDADPQSLLNHYRAMLAFRATLPALAKGTIEFADAPQSVLAFTRKHEGEMLFVAINTTSAPAVFAMPAGRWETLQSPAPRGEARADSLELPAYGAWFGRAAG